LLQATIDPGSIFFILLICTGCPAPGTTGPSVLFQEDFSSYTAGDHLNPAQWEPYVNPGGSIANDVIAETGKALHLVTDHYVLSSGGSAWTDYTYTVDVKTTATGFGFGIYFRAHSGASPGGPAYTVKLQGGNQIVLISSVGGTLEDISTGFSYSADQYYPLKVVVKGDNIKVSFNNVQVIDHTDTGTTLTSGSIGFCADGDNAYFDNIVVTSP
jgi:hypothetical protein